jgi:hypothetical protein
MYAFFAATTDILHALAMVVWALGLPLLIWHRFPRISAAYTGYAVVFVVISQASHAWLGECFLTTLSRTLWSKSGAATHEARISFTSRLVEAVAGIRPSEQSVVLIWESAIVATAVALVVQSYRTRHGRHHARSGTRAVAR